MKKYIPIFPLNLVMFPKSKYPLHIFEERYKKMVNKCLDEKTGFGVIAQIGSDLSKVGCYVIIYDLLNKYESGEMDIIVEGKKRFKINNLTVNPDGYYFAEVESYSDIMIPVDPYLVSQMLNKFKEILEKFNFQLEDTFWNIYKKSRRKSFKLAEKAGLTLEQQQQLLKIQNENERISFLIKHFEKLEDEITKNAAVRSIVLGDGYLNN
jgi:ATP-dependent Lon protease